MPPFPKPLPEGWFLSDNEEAAVRHEELQKELPEGHLLYRTPVAVVARREGTDDILCHHERDWDRFTVIHLSWIGRTEINAEHPTVEVDGDFDAFLEYESAFGRT